MFSGVKRSNPARRSVVGSSFVFASIVAGQVAHAKGTPGNEADTEFLAGLEDAVRLDVSFHEGVLGLNRGHRLHRMRSTDGRGVRLRKAEVQDFARRDQCP